MKNFLFTIILSILFLSCSEDTGITENNKKIQGPDYQAGSNIHRHFCKPIDPNIKPHCAPPKRDCFDDVIVEAPRPKAEDFILTEHILNNTVYLYFDENNVENYQVLFPNFDGPALSDLRNNLTTLRKIVNDDTNIVTYYIVFTADTNLTPDYSEYY